MRFANYRRRFLGFLRLSVQPLIFKDEPYEQKIDRNSNGKHRYGRQRFGNAQPQKQIQQPHVKQVIDQMRTTKTETKRKNSGNCLSFFISIFRFMLSLLVQS